MPCNAFFMYLEDFFKVPFSDPLWSPKQRKKGHLQKPATKQRNKNKGYNANNTSTHLPPLELMPHNAFLMYLEHFFKVPFSDPLWSPKQRKTGTCKNLQQNKETKTEGYNANNTSTHLPSLDLLALPSWCIWNMFSSCPLLTPFITSGKETRPPLKNEPKRRNVPGK